MTLLSLWEPGPKHTHAHREKGGLNRAQPQPTHTHKGNREIDSNINSRLHMQGDRPKSESREPNPLKSTGDLCIEAKATPYPHPKPEPSHLRRGVSASGPEDTRMKKLKRGAPSKKAIQEPELIRIAQEAAREADKEPRGSKVDLGIRVDLGLKRQRSSSQPNATAS